MDRRLIGTLAAVAFVAAASSIGCDRSNEQRLGTTSMQSVGPSDPEMAKADGGGWYSLSANALHMEPGPAASKDAGGQSVLLTSAVVGSAAASGDK